MIDTVNRCMQNVGNRRWSMGYMHIENLYKNRDILMFKECYAMEKIHGTSAHIWFSGGKIGFFSGGEPYEKFCKLFDVDVLLEKFTSVGADNIIIYGEAYGGRCQGMRETYGPDLRFIAFEVYINGCWLDVPKAEDVVRALGLEFVDYVRTTTDIDTLDSWRDAPSSQSVRNGIAEERKREGIVLRPIIELTKNNGQRIISKHKGAEFLETKSIRKLKDADLSVLLEACAIVEEWVTPMRFNHVIQKFGKITDMKAAYKIIEAMVEDVEREGAGEIVLSKEVRSGISKRTVELYKQYIQKLLKEV